MAAPVSRATSDELASIVVTAGRAPAGAQAESESDVAVDGETVATAAQGNAAAAITIPEWSPARPWIDALDGAGDNWQPVLERLAGENGQLPLFWFDVGEWQYRKGRAAEARRAVETALELPARDNQTLAIVSARLQRYGDLDRAIALMEQLADREDERPQPLRTLAVLLMQRAEGHRAAGRNDAAKADLQRAIQLLADAVLKVRREGYRGFEETALMDANLAVQRFRALGGRDHALPPALVRMLDVDIRVVVEWNTPRTDLDLWVEEPSREDVGYSNRISAWGGRLTADVTNGFGPEEYMIRVSQPGTYSIRANTFAADRTNPNGPSTLAARLIRNFGRANQTEELIDIEMEPTSNGRQLIGRITIGPNAGRGQGRGR
jgi:tetratricopeptide (TPR) repeat protein